jgi:glycosyltransferase involved in cell wall biosynthesis
VVIPAYNAAAFLGEAILSVVSQQGPSCELIVVNDGSTDATAEVAAGFPEVRLVNRSNGGIGAARNTGLREATAPLVAFLDADDVWPDGRLAALAEAMTPDCDAVFGQAVQFGEGREETAPQPALLASTMLIRREACERVGEFREELKVGEFVD